jgi:uncharacterized protein YpmS
MNQVIWHIGAEAHRHYREIKVIFKVKFKVVSKQIEMIIFFLPTFTQNDHTFSHKTSGSI